MAIDAPMVHSVGVKSWCSIFFVCINFLTVLLDLVHSVGVKSWCSGV